MTREEAIQWLSDALTSPIIYGDYAVALCMAIEALSAEPAKHGHWIERAKCEYRCDQCGKIVFADDENELNYCCSCGAKMKSED